MLDNFSQQLAQLLMQPAAIPFGIAFIGGFFVYQVRDRRMMLAAKAGVDILYGAYFWLMQAYAGAYGIMIAVLGGLVQILTPNHLMGATALYRKIIAALLALLGIFLITRHTSDLLPLIAASSARFVETQDNPHRIRIGMGFILLLWIAYASINGLYLIMGAHVTLLASLLLALYRHRKQA